jgi:hypothetical protein
LLLAALQLNGIAWSENSIHPQAAIDLITRFAQNWLPDRSDPQQTAIAILQAGVEPELEGYRTAGAEAFKRFHNNIGEKAQDQWSMRSTDDLARVFKNCNCTAAFCAGSIIAGERAGARFPRLLGLSD